MFPEHKFNEELFLKYTRRIYELAKPQCSDARYRRAVRKLEEIYKTKGKREVDVIMDAFERFRRIDDIIFAR